MKLTHIVAGTALLLSGFTAGSLAIGLSASATSNSITFYSCSNKTTGVLSATSTKVMVCAKTSTLVSWNSVGPEGAPGARGASGISLPSGMYFANGWLIMPNANLFGADLSSSNSSTNLSNANLRGANLSSAILRAVNLTNANLRGANLQSSNLTSTNFTSADLGGANLQSANLTSTNLFNANLDGADLGGANLSNTNLSTANISVSTTCPNGILHGQPRANC